MIQLTNDTKSFFEKDPDIPIYIYGAGKNGYWLSYYMNRCNISFQGFIDKTVETTDCYAYGKRVIHPSRIAQYEKCAIKIAISIYEYGGAIGELMPYGNSNDVLCLIPIYKNFMSNSQIFDINKFLGYFRNKLLNVAGRRYPSIISNTCAGGLIYRNMDILLPASPTINTHILMDDFIKLCREPQKYFETDIVFDHWGYLSLFPKNRYPVGRVKDIFVYFIHFDSIEKAVRTWNILRKKVDYSNMIYIFSDAGLPIPYQTAKEFCDMKEKHLLIIQNGVYTGLNGMLRVGKSAINPNADNPLHIRGGATENWFDVLGWMNGDFEV